MSGQVYAPISLPYYNDSNWQLLIEEDQYVEFQYEGKPGALPRRTKYGSPAASKHGLVPMGDYPDALPSEADFKEIITFCHAERIFPMYHRLESKVLLQKPTQNGFNFCWAWALTHSVENALSVIGEPPIVLGPTSLGGDVGYRNEGNYLDSAIKYANEYGIAPAEYCPLNTISPRNFKEGWQEIAKKRRPTEWWDTDRSQGTLMMIKWALAMLRTGRTLYSAYDWWRHAVCIVGLEWDESQPNNVVWVVFNSHADGLIRLAGNRGVPSEMYGVRDVTRN